MPRNARSIAPSLSSASVPPTPDPRGQVSWIARLSPREREPRSPVRRPTARQPRHKDRAHGTRSCRPPRVRPSAPQPRAREQRRASSHPPEPGGADRHPQQRQDSTATGEEVGDLARGPRVAEPRPEVGVDAAASPLSVAAAKNRPPVVCAIICSVCGLGGTRIVSTYPPGISCSTVPPGVPSEIVYTGTCSRRACCAAALGVVKPPSGAPSEIASTVVGGVDPSVAFCCVPEPCREQHSVADRCPLARVQRPERRLHEVAVGRGRRARATPGARSDDGDLERFGTTRRNGWPPLRRRRSRVG